MNRSTEDIEKKDLAKIDACKTPREVWEVQRTFSPNDNYYSHNMVGRCGIKIEKILEEKEKQVPDDHDMDAATMYEILRRYEKIPEDILQVAVTVGDFTKDTMRKLLKYYTGWRNFYNLIEEKGEDINEPSHWF